MKKLSTIEADLNKSVAYKKACTFAFITYKKLHKFTKSPSKKLQKRLSGGLNFWETYILHWGI